MVDSLVVAKKLKYHRLKAWWCPGMVDSLVVAKKLKYHRLKPGGVRVHSRENKPGVVRGG